MWNQYQTINYLKRRDKMLKQFFKKLFIKIKQRFSAINKKTIAVILALSIVLSVPVTIYEYIKISHTNYMTITLNYSNARKGLTPNGARFNIAEIKSDKVLKKALDYLGDDSLSIETVKSRITINSKSPQSSVENVKNSVSKDESYTYCPSEFVIYYNQGSKLERNKTGAFLYALSRAYEDYFAENYAGKNSILEYDIAERLNDYDYKEQFEMLQNKVSEMLRYLDKYNSENNTFRSQTTGYTFGDLISILSNIKNVDLEKLEAYVVQNGVTKNKTNFLLKQNYLFEQKSFQHKMTSQSSIIAKNAMDEYDSHITSVAFVPAYDEKNEFYMSRTKTGLDIIVLDSYSDGLTASNFSKQIDNINYLKTKFQAAPTITQAQKDEVAKMINDIGIYVSKVSNLAIQTDRDYSKSTSNGYITVIFNSIPRTTYLKLIIKVFALFLIIFIAIYACYKTISKKASKKIVSVINYLSNKLKLDELNEASNN